MWSGFVLLVLLGAAQITGIQAQNNSDKAALGCLDVRQLMSSTESILLDGDALAVVQGDLQHILDCLPQGAVIQLDLPDLKQNETLKIERSVSIKGSRTSIPCLNEITQPTIEISSNDVLLAGFSFVGCNLTTSSGLLQVQKSQNVTLRDMVFESNTNTNGPSCVSAMESTIEIQNVTMKSNTGVHGGAMSLVKGSKIIIVGSAFESNRATEQGGAIHMHNSNLDLSNSRFIENLAFDDGGAIFAVGAVESGKESVLTEGGAVYLSDVPEISIVESTFTKNQAERGGGIAVGNNALKNPILSVNGSTFEGNSATGSSTLSYGGALALFRVEHLNCSVENSIFQMNKADLGGGAIFGWRVSWVKLSTSSFQENSCGVDLSPSEGALVESGEKSFVARGGAVYLSEVPEISIVDSNLTKNHARDGGALFVSAHAPGIANVEVRGTNFERNSAEARGMDVSSYGGAMSLVGNGTSSTIDGVAFLDNMAEQGGGAIWGADTRSINICQSIFARNKAVRQATDDGEQKGHGGVLLLINVPELSINKSTFTDNQAGTTGGVIFLSTVVNGSNANFVGCTFHGNSAGAVHGLEISRLEKSRPPVSDSKAGGGLALFGDVLRASIKDSNFKKNKANSSGGAVYGLEISRLEISHSSFSENKVVRSGGETSGVGVEGIENTDGTFGGAVFLGNIPETVIVNSSFVHDEAEDGGGIYVRVGTQGGMLLIEGSDFHHNVAMISGGAIGSVSTNATIVKSNFTRNTGNDGGGAINFFRGIFAEGKPHLKTKGVAFKHNYAGNTGGGLRALGVDLEIEDSVFQNNSADSGGAINLLQFAAASPSAIIKTTSFTGNQAAGGGGIHMQNGNLSVADCAFDANIARLMGGALFCEDKTLNFITGNKDSFVTVHSSNFTYNKAGKEMKGDQSAGVESINSKGGAVAVSGLGLFSEFKHCTFSSNLAKRGGAMYVSDAIKLTVEDSSFSMGAALTGGALSVISTEVTVNNVTFIENAAKVGGAVSLSQFDTATFTTDFDLVVFKMARFVGNTAMEGGGAIDLRERNLECKSCLFDSNSAGLDANEIGSGGAIRALPASNVTLVNSSIVSCMATQSGGGVYLEDAIFLGENITIRNSTAIEKGGGFAMHFATFASNQLAPWRCRSCSIQENQAKEGGGLHVSADETTQPNCQALRPTFLVENLPADCERSLVKPESQVLLDKTVFGGNHAEDSGSDIFLSNFKNNICCDDQCWSMASQLDEGVKKCGLGGTLQRNAKNPAPLGTIFESVLMSPPGILNHASGGELPAVEVTPLDSFGQIAMDNLTLRVEVATPGGELFGSPVTSEGVLMSGVLTVTGVSMRALPGNYNLSFKLTSDDGKRIVTELLSVDVRECVTGEVSREEGLRCDRCADDFFSFDVSDENCRPCPVEEAKCSGGRLAPLDGFWHSGRHSSHLHACLTEEACAYPNRTGILFASNSSGAYPQCAKGYSGVLCGSCDTSHGRSRFKCTECQGGVPAGLGIGGVMLALAVLSLIYVKSAAKHSRGVLGERSNSISTTGAVPSGSHGGFNLPAFIAGEVPQQDAETPHENVHQNPPRRKTMSSDIFKILVNFLQVTASAGAINVGWSQSMLMIFSSWDVVSGVADSSSFFSFECAFSSGKSNVPRSIQTSIFLAIVPFMVWAALVAVHYSHALRWKKSFQDIKLWSGVALLAVQQASYISLTRTLVRIFYCVDANPVEGLFWVQDTSVGCYKGSHAFLVGFIGAPGLLFISIGFPGWLLFKLTRSTEILEQEEVVRKYGFLYQAYKNNVAAWEVVILLRKALLAAVVVFGRTLGEGIQTSLALFIMVGSIILQMQFRPFMVSKLNMLELGSLAISTLAFIVGNLVDQPKMSDGGRVAMSVIFIGTTAIYIVYMLKQIFDMVFWELREWMENANSGSPLPSSNVGLLITVLKTQVKKTNVTLNKKKDAFAERVFACLSCQMSSR